MQKMDQEGMVERVGANLVVKNFSETGSSLWRRKERYRQREQPM